MSPNFEERGQTAIDFVIGIALFLLAVAFVLAFVPSMFAPFHGADAADGLVADRSAAHLVETKFVEDPSAPGALNESQVTTFFEDCADEENTGAWVADALGVGTENILVSIDGINESPCGGPADDAETVSTRIVTIDGEIYTLEVVVW